MGEANQKINVHCILKKAEDDPEIFEKEMTNLGKYHAQDKHTWDGGACSFHEQIICSCGTCDSKEVRKEKKI